MTRSREDLKKNTIYFAFYPQIIFPWEGKEFLISLPCRCYIPKLEKIGPLYVNERRTTTDANPQVYSVTQVT